MVTDLLHNLTELLLPGTYVYFHSHVLARIFWYLDGPSLEASNLVCRRWNHFVKEAVKRGRIRVRKQKQPGKCC